MVAVATWLQRRGVATTFRKAVAAAKGLIKEYDEAPYTAEDVASIEAAGAPQSQTTRGTQSIHSVSG